VTFSREIWVDEVIR